MNADKKLLLSPTPNDALLDPGDNKKQSPTTMDAFNKIEDVVKLNIKALSTEDKYNLIPSDPELLGSVTTSSSPALRASARVIQKMKMDSIRPTTPPPPPPEKKGKAIEIEKYKIIINFN